MRVQIGLLIEENRQIFIVNKKKKKKQNTLIYTLQNHNLNYLLIRTS